MKSRSVLKGCSDWTDADYLEFYKSKCVITERGCWEWQGWKCLSKGLTDRSRGYPMGSYRGKATRLTRLLLGWKIGRPLTKEEKACHDCDNPPCINPDHLHPGTDQENMQEAGRKKRWPRQYRDTCIHGHPRTPENMLRWGTLQKLVCKVCLRERNAKRYRERTPEMRERVKYLKRLRIERQQLNREVKP